MADEIQWMSVEMAQEQWNGAIARVECAVPLRIVDGKIAVVPRAEIDALNAEKTPSSFAHTVEYAVGSVKRMRHDNEG